MGSFGAALNVSERLRPWFQFGVEYMFPTMPEQPEVTEQSSLPAPLQSALESPVHAFSAPWDMFWGKACKTASVAWTYMELGCDLGGSPNRERGMLFRNLIQRMQWPAGTSAFWPMSEPAENGCTPRVDMFWQGLVRLGAVHVICCGSDVLDLIAPDCPYSDSSFQLGPFMIHPLPSPSKMLNTPEYQETAIHTLSAVF